MPDSSPSSDQVEPVRRSAIASWRALGSRDKRRLLLLMALLPLVHAALAMFRVQRVRGWLERNSAGRTPVDCTPERLADAQRLAELAAIAGRRGAVEASCLRQALVVWWWLRRRGLSPQLRLGTLGSGAGFAAHAWVELDSVALAQRDLRHRPIEGW
jgi:hypothetical protein